MAIFEPKLSTPALALVLLAGDVYAQPQSTVQDPQAVVREVVMNELRAQQDDQTHWMYVSRKGQPGNDQTEEVIEARQGVLSRIIAENGHPLTPLQKQQQDQRIQRVIHSPSELRKEKQEHERDEQKEQQLLAMMPDGFLYQYEGDEGRDIRLSFRPNPRFHPPTREAEVFHAMEGTIVVEDREKRLKELRGRLTRDVLFGWGILGRLNEGGTFDVRQEEVAPGHREVTLIDVHITGKALFFRTISEQQHDVRNEFQQVPGSLTLAQAVEVLKAKDCR